MLAVSMLAVSMLAVSMLAVSMLAVSMLAVSMLTASQWTKAAAERCTVASNDFGGANGGHWVHGWRNGRYGWWRGDGLGWAYYPEYYSEYGLPSAAPYWYCAIRPAITPT